MTRSAPSFDDTFRTALADLIAWRRDVRHFRPDPLPAGMVDQLLHLACQGPSVGLSQPWRWVLVDSPDRRSAIQDNFRHANEQALAGFGGERAALYARLKLSGLAEAPVHLAVFVDSDTAQGSGLGRATMPEMLAYSAVCAIQTLWLAARACGVGMGWVSILHPQQVRETLDVPPHWQLVAYLCLGYPREDQDVPELEQVGWEMRNPTHSTIFKR